jgi:hypothetical protein
VMWWTPSSFIATAVLQRPEAGLGPGLPFR